MLCTCNVQSDGKHIHDDLTHDGTKFTINNAQYHALNNVKYFPHRIEFDKYDEFNRHMN